MRNSTKAPLDLVAEKFKEAPTQALEALVDDLDKHPLFRPLLPEERREFRRRAQLELAKRHDSMVSRWVRIGGRVEYDDEFHLVLHGTPDFVDNVLRGLGLAI